MRIPRDFYTWAAYAVIANLVAWAALADVIYWLGRLLIDYYTRGAS